MTAPAVTIDTNILVYAVDSGNPQKQGIAGRIVTRLAAIRAALPMQCLTEFYNVTTRKRLLTPLQAETYVRWVSDNVVVLPADWSDLKGAMALHRQHHLQFFDALLIATAERSGASVLFSEDLQPGRTFGAMRVVDPFTFDEPSFDALLA